MKLVMGSCRVAEPMKDLPDVVLYPGGHVHSTAEFLQALRIMRGDVVPPHDIEPHLFRGWGERDDKRVDLDAVDTAIMELCSLKSYRYGTWLLHIGYEENVASGELSPLEGVVLHRESLEEVRANLNEIGSILDGKQLVFVLQNNIPHLPERYLLGYVVAEWCRQHPARLVDATALIAESGIERCLPVRDGVWDYLHYTDQMKARIREVLSDEGVTGAYVSQVPQSVLDRVAREKEEQERSARRAERRLVLRARLGAAARRVPGLMPVIRSLRGLRG